MLTLQLKNNLTNQKELFKKDKKDEVLMYVCGITPYDYAHLGHGRCYVSFDILYRLLSRLGYKVKYCRNFTDIDDKLINKAVKEYGDKSKYTLVAQKFIDAYQEDMEQLNCLPPSVEPRVTEVIPEIIQFITDLIKNGYAYEANGSVYFSVNRFDQYGKLSKRTLDEMIAGKRVAVTDEKKNSADFALWKNELEGGFWDSPWGNGRPGWHIECSVMAKKFLGQTIDIHGGGMDLIFPHHENEIAQSEALHGKKFSRFWIHNAFVQIDKEKMSKSLGNFFTLRELFEKFDPMVLRYMILTHHYRYPIDFSFDELSAVQKTYKRLCRIFSETKASKKLNVEEPIIKRMFEFLCDDLNSPGMLGAMFENIHFIQDDVELRSQVKFILQDVLGLLLEPIKEQKVAMTKEIEGLIKERSKARQSKDWARADVLRDKLKELGYDQQDDKINK